MFETLKNLIANDIVALIALVALVSPPITAIIDNLFKLIAKHLDFKRNVYDNEFNHKRALFENFLSYTGQLHLDSDRYINDLTKAYFALSPYVSKEDFEKIKNALSLFELPIQIDGFNAEKVLSATKSDKKMVGNQVKFILLKEIGNAYIYRKLTDEQILDGIRYVCHS